MVDVIFVNPYPEDAYGINETTVEPPLGLGYLAAITEENSLSCKIIDANISHLKINDILKEIKNSCPKIVGISVNLYSYRTSLNLTNKIKEKFKDMKIILGGPTPSSVPLKIMESCKADAVIVGEGEKTFDDMLKNYKNNRHLFSNVDGIFYREKGRVIKNKPRDFIGDIDSLPFPAYHLFPDLRVYKSRARKKPSAPLLTSRGCPFGCIYCSKDVFKRVCRMRSPENVIQEIDMLVKRYKVKQIDILDDNFTMDKRRAEKILDLLIERDYDLYINLQSGVRTEGIDQNIIDKMKKAKVFKIPFGVESGDESILKRIKKQLNLNDVLKATKMAKKAGIKVYGFFMLGLPGDTPQTMQKTIDFAIKMDPNIANFCITTPFPGTELHSLIKREGRFLVDMEDGINAGFYANQVFYEMEGMNKDTILNYYKRAMRSFYFRPRKIFELAASMRNFYEFKWLLGTSFSIIRNMLRPKNV